MYQDVVDYVNPQWMDIGTDMVEMFTGSMTAEDVMAASTSAAPTWPPWQATLPGPSDRLPTHHLAASAPGPASLVPALRP